MKAANKRKNSMAAKLVLAVITLLNLGLSLALSLQRRGEVLHAVEENDEVKLLLTTGKETKK